MPFTYDKQADVVLKKIMGAVEHVVQESIEVAVKDAMADIHKRVEERVRSKVGMISANVLEHFNMQRMGSELRITVDFKNLTKPVEEKSLAQDYLDHARAKK